jgi:hypothetical protein
MPWGASVGQLSVVVTHVRAPIDLGSAPCGATGIAAASTTGRTVASRLRAAQVMATEGMMLRRPGCTLLPAGIIPALFRRCCCRRL